MSQKRTESKIDDRSCWNRIDEPLHSNTPPIAMRVLTELPLLIKHSALERRVSLGNHDGKAIFRFDPPTEHRFALLNPFILRDEFLALQDAAAALAFLSCTGAFRAPLSTPSTIPAELTWDELKLWQEVIRSSMLYGRNITDRHGQGRNISPKVPTLDQDPLRTFIDERAPTSARGWLYNQPSEFHLEPRSGSDQDEHPKLWMQIITHQTLNAMLAATYVDRLMGVRFEICELPECMNLYEVTSKQARQYCTNAHAHKAAVRRKREEVRKAAGRLIRRIS